MLRFPDDDLPADHPDRALLAGIAQRLNVAADRVALAGSVAEFIEQALANRPQLRDARQQALTDRYLARSLPALERLFLDLRADLDPVLRRAQPHRGSRPYPLGQCLEISRAVQQRLESLDPVRLSGAAAEGWTALSAFRAAGGEVRRAWGDLRGEYFQNALIIGVLYVDVSNDTVVITKSPVEIRPFAEADFRPVADYAHFAHIAQRYWKSRFVPNHLLPEVAPYLPLIEIAANGRMRLGPSGLHMLAVTLAETFLPSERALAVPALAPTLFGSLSAALRGDPIAVAASAEEGREAALAACRAYRAEARFDCAASLNRAMVAAQEVNRRLAGLVAVPAAA